MGFDYLSSQICEGLWLLHKDQQITLATNKCDTHHGAKVDDLPERTDKELAELAHGWGDLFIYGSAGNTANYSDTINSTVASKTKSTKLVFLDGHDGNGFLVNPDDQLVYFKRECRLPEVGYMIKYPNVRSLTFGVYQYLLDYGPTPGWDDRDIDLCFMAFGGSNPLRMLIAETVQKHLSHLSVEVHVAENCQPVNQAKYHEILYRSKYGISIPGAGFDTLRYWETPAHGAVLYSFYLPMMMRNGFEPGRHYYPLVDPSQMAEHVQNIVVNKQLWTRIRQATDKCLPKQSTKHRAGELLDICREMM